MFTSDEKKYKERIAELKKKQDAAYTELFRLLAEAQALTKKLQEIAEENKT